MRKLIVRVSDKRFSFLSYTKWSEAIDKAKSQGLFVAVIKLRPRRKNNGTTKTQN